MRKSHVVFYGSLMQGEPPYFGAQQNIPIEGKIQFLRECTVSGFLYDLGNYPGLIETNITHEDKPLVQAELYEILAPEALAMLDEYEGFYPSAPESSFYLRKQVQLEGEAKLESSNKPIKAWCYFFNESIDEMPLIESGCWRTHLRSRPLA